MKYPISRLSLILLISLLAGLTGMLRAQGALADYRRADTLAQHFEGKAHHVIDELSWINDSHRLWYRKTVEGGHVFILVDADSQNRERAFDHERLQPRHTTRRYTKPGDVLEKEMPVLFLVEKREQITIDNSLFPNAYSQSGLEWWSDSRAFHFEYNARGHEEYKVIEVDADTGSPRALILEEGNPFVSYSTTNWRYDTDNGEEIIWASERDNWRHLYLYDGRSGEVKNQITSGEWVVREIDSVDTANRQIWFRASGMESDQDPYFLHAYRINFDGSGLTRLTGANGTHTVNYSDDMQYYVDRWSRVDAAPRAVLRRTSDKSVVMELEEADLRPLREAGWRSPQPFTAKGRDGETDIWGVIVRPTDFDPSKNYPVIEYIYAGPHDSFVPKEFDTYSHMMSLAELGFVVVQIDGMGTDNRSKEFHNVAWKNLKDAGFPDRIRWHKAAAAEYDWYDISKVGIYGTSAGGQSSMGALLFHPEFYKAAVSASGCHDNRMDKIWWNEQWMGWPVGPQYAASSNVEHARRLQGDLMLIVGNQDTNVPPTSTYQVADALVEAGKDFDFFVIPNGGHTSGGELGERMRRDFFVEHILDAEPPHWNSMEETNSR